MPVRRGTNFRPFNIHRKRLNNQRNDMIKQIKNTGGDWPTTNETLVNNYLQIFVNFVKSIDFTDLQSHFI